MSTRKTLPIALLGAAVLALSGAAALAQTTGQPAPEASMAPGGMRHMGRMHREHHERHPELRRAWHGLKMAENALSHAAHDFGGHRAKALDLVKQAEAELQAAQQYDKK